MKLQLVGSREWDEAGVRYGNEGAGLSGQSMDCRWLASGIRERQQRWVQAGYEKLQVESFPGREWYQKQSVRGKWCPIPSRC